MSAAVRSVPPPGPGEVRPFDFPSVQRSELPNGMDVVSARTGELPVATLQVLLPAGAVSDPEGREGLAWFTAALLESGAAGQSGSRVAEEMEALGMQLSIVGGWDFTQLELTGLRSRLDGAVELLAALVREPSFPGAEVERIRAEQRATILQRRAEPRGLANEAAARFLFSDTTPFSRPVGGTLRSLARLARSDVLAYHSSHYTPRGAAVIGAGDLDHDAVRVLAGRAFGDWAGPAPAAPQVTVQPRRAERRVVLVDRPGAVQSEIRVAQIGVPRSTPDYFAIAVMNAILGGAFTSRLNLNLRETHGYTYGVSSGFTMRRSPGPFLVSTAVQTEVTALALSEIFREIGALIEGPVTADEVADARSYLAGTFPLRLQTTDGVAGRLSEMVAYGLPRDYFAHFRSRVLAVTREEVQEAARRHLRPGELTVVIAGDGSRIRTEIEGLGLGTVEVTDVAEFP